MCNLNLSRYSFIFEREDGIFLYSSKNNNFYRISKGLKDRLNTTPIVIDEEELGYLREKGLLCTEKEDDEYYSLLKNNHLISSYSTRTLHLTILPTLGCNLRCPYCFEGEKRGGAMTDETIDEVVKFIKNHRDAKQYTLTWFGGEPLVGLKAMRGLLEKLSDKGTEKECINHSIVTNGTLLRGEAIELFKKYPLNSIQVTLDGQRERHDTKRVYPTGSGSFDEIMLNLSSFVREFPKCRVSVRVNIDNDNKDDYDALVERLKSDLPDVYPYPALLRPTKECVSYSYFNVGDTVAFYKNHFKKNSPDSFYPSHKTKGCTATSISSYVIGPEGELYRCWEHVGKEEYVVGNVSRGLTNPGLVARYMLEGTAFADEKCRKCGLLPICSGGCPDRRIKASGEEGTSLCDMLSHCDNEVLGDFLYEYFLTNRCKCEK